MQILLKEKDFLPWVCHVLLLQSFCMWVAPFEVNGAWIHLRGVWTPEEKLRLCLESVFILSLADFTTDSASEMQW